MKVSEKYLKYNRSLFFSSLNCKDSNNLSKFYLILLLSIIPIILSIFFYGSDRDKRKITNDPVDCLIIECKKKKLTTINDLNDETKSINNNKDIELRKDNDVVKQIFKYAGCTRNDDELHEKIIKLNYSKTQCFKKSSKYNK